MRLRGNGICQTHSIWMYGESVDFAPPQPADLRLPVRSHDSVSQPSAIQEPASYLKEISGLAIDEFWQEADADSVGLGKDELARALLAIGAKHNYGLPPGIQATRAQVGAFWRALQLHELALAQACALGRDIAWQRFLAEYREPLTQAAIGITASVATGTELADSLYSEIFGLTERNGQRQSPLASYSGRGSLKGFLRATLAQRNVDRYRRTRRETSLENEDWPAASPAPIPASDVLSRLGESVTTTLGSLGPEERFLLSAWFLDRHTLLEIAQTLRVHEATVSRRIKRLTSKIRKELLKSLRASGMSGAAAEEALGTDPRYLDLNLRRLLQTSQSATFLPVAGVADPEQI
jgi:RNA polymerase sigma-70 factor (ECF subfamily)